MLRIDLKSQCSGCGLCVARCPKKCLQMAADSEGFRYPVFVDSAACIKCGLCEDSCPVRHQTFLPERHQAAPVVAAVNRDEAVRLDSTSGGVFSALAVDIFRRGGYVGGAVYQSDHSVKHILTNDPERLADLRSSKYLESRFEDIFPEAEKLLRAGELVFIAGVFDGSFLVLRAKGFTNALD